MRPPYDPAHVERVLSPYPEHVVARCSCGWEGDAHDLHLAGAARKLAADLDAHRETYVQEQAS